MATRNNRRQPSASRKDASDLPKKPLSQAEPAPRSSNRYTVSSDLTIPTAMDPIRNVRDLNLASPRSRYRTSGAFGSVAQNAPKSPKFPYKGKSTSLDDVSDGSDSIPETYRDESHKSRPNRASSGYDMAFAGSSRRPTAMPAEDAVPADYATRRSYGSSYRSNPDVHSTFRDSSDMRSKSRASSDKRSKQRMNVSDSGATASNRRTASDSGSTASHRRTASRYTVSASEPNSPASRRHDPKSFYANMFEDDPRAVYAGGPSGAAARTPAGARAGEGGFLSGVAHIIRSLWNRSKAVVIIALVVLLAVGAFIVDGVASANRIHNGVHVGSVDVSGLTVDEAAALINDNYAKNLYSTSVYIFADEETANSADLDMHVIESESLAEQLSFEEVQAQKKLWITSASDLNAEIPAKEIAEEAFSVGRDDGGLFARLGAMISGSSVDVHANFDETLLSNLIADINSTLGSEVRDYGIEIEHDKASVTSGNDGYMLNNDDFTSAINEALLADEESIKGFVADIEYTNYRIDEESANETCEAINAAVPDNVEFVWDGKTYEFDKPEIMSWVSTRIVEMPKGTERSSKSEWYLEPYLNPEKGVPAILGEIIETDYSDFSYTFESDESGIFLQPSTGIELPVTDEALSSLDDDLFFGYRQTLKASGVPDLQPIEIESRVSADRMTVDDAMSFGLVKEFSTYTTKYTNTKSTANRTYNVHLAADKIGDSIVSADGKWSFNEIAGSCDESSGFTEANVINSGEYTQAFGGGICQVATTVFNAVYNAGLKINERHNHTLYSSSYPAGLDAAIAYPDWDLVWTNSTNSDILLRTSYTDTSITVKLIGRDPNREITTFTGDWIDGAKHTTKYEEDPTLAANASYVKTAGTDGLKISVTRLVTDDKGEVLYEDNYYSSYSPIQRVIVFGPGTDMAALRAKYSEET